MFELMTVDPSSSSRSMPASRISFSSICTVSLSPMSGFRSATLPVPMPAMPPREELDRDADHVRLLADPRLHALLPQIPDAFEHGEIDRIGLRPFLGAEIGDLGAEPDRLGLQARVDVGVIGPGYGDLDVGSDRNVPVPSHQHDG